MDLRVTLVLLFVVYAPFCLAGNVDYRQFINQYENRFKNDFDAQNGMKTPQMPTYFIVAPNKVRPSMVVQVAVAIRQMLYPTIAVTVSVRRQDEELCSVKETFYRESMRILQMKMPVSLWPGNYSIRVEGAAPGAYGIMFLNETRVEFDVKQASCFIQTDRPMYRNSQIVKARAVIVLPNLMPVYDNVDIYIKDSSGFVVRRWLQLQTNFGVVEVEFPVDPQPRFGNWTIQVFAFNTYYNHSFEVKEFYMPRYDINISMPAYLPDNGYALSGVLVSNHSTSFPGFGNATLTMTIITPDKRHDSDEWRKAPKLVQNLGIYNGRSFFFFTMQQLGELVSGSLAEKLVFINVTCKDWYFNIVRHSWAATYIYKNMARVTYLGGRVRSFKPGQPFNVLVAVSRPDGSPLITGRRRVYVKERARLDSGAVLTLKEFTYILPTTGILEHIVFPSDGVKSIDVWAQYEDEPIPDYAVRAFRYQSIGDYRIYITSPTQQSQINEFTIFTVRTTTYVDTVYYVIVAHGNVILGDSLYMTSRQRTFSVAMSREMSPQARIVAWYFAPNGQTVVDGINFFVNATRQDDVQVIFNRGKDLSWNSVEVVVRGDPGAFVATSCTNYDIFMFGGRNDLTEYQVTRELETYDSHANLSFQYTWHYQDRRYDTIYFPSPSYGNDPNQTFWYAGLLYFTDGHVFAVNETCNVTRGELPCADGSCYDLRKRCDRQWDCVWDGADEMGCPEPEPFLARSYLNLLGEIGLHYRDFSWLWKTEYVKYYGQIEMQVDVPQQPQLWMVSALTVSRNLGLGVMQQPVLYDGSRRFFMTIDCPAKVQWGEQVGVRVAIFNYWHKYIEVLVTAPRSTEYQFVKVEENGYVESYNPRLTSLDMQTLVLVESNQAKYLTVPVRPSKFGLVNVTVYAASFMGEERRTCSLDVRWNGVTNYYHNPYMLDLAWQAQALVPLLRMNVSQIFQGAEQFILDYVLGSPRAVVSVVGDVFGTPIDVEEVNTRSLLMKPIGGVEHTMFNFAANLYTLQYLKVINQFRSEATQRAFTTMNLALQRLLSYAVLNETGYMNGSFYGFRDRSDPSVWGTAFAGKALVLMHAQDWELTPNAVYIEVPLLNRIYSWLCDQQDPITGAFHEIGSFYETRMRPKASMTDDLTLTAFVLISLAEADRTKGLTGSASSCVSAAKNLAKDYLQANTPQIIKNDNVYQLAIVTYALKLATGSDWNSLWNTLDKHRRRVAEGEFFSDVPIPPRLNTRDDNFYNLWPRYIMDYDAQAIEATAYAMMIALDVDNGESLSTPLMRWLQFQRMTNGGWASSQDTVVALEALAYYASKDRQRPLFNFNVNVRAPQSIEYSYMVHLGNDNFTAMTYVDLPIKYGPTKMVGDGTGRALVQLMTTVNVEHTYKVWPQQIPSSFDLELDVQYSGFNFSSMHYFICSRWIGDGDNSGMAVLEVDAPSGYYLMNDDLRDYVLSGDSPRLRYAWWEDKLERVSFYFSNLTSQRECIRFTMERWYPVANVSRQHKITLYDYYEPGRLYSSLFEAENLFSLNICKVCGSWQCPWCNFYNFSPRSMTFVGLFTILFISLATLLYGRSQRLVDGGKGGGPGLFSFCS